MSTQSCLTGHPSSGFELRLPLAKTWEDDAGELWVEGVASSTCVDRQSERMSREAIEAMSQAQGIALLPGHHTGHLRELGTIEECWIDNDEFRVRGRLDRTNPDARRLYQRLCRGRRCGLSVGGRVRQAHWETDAATGGSVRVIDDVELDHIALCRLGDAANPNAYLSALGKAAGIGGAAADDEVDGYGLGGPSARARMLEALGGVSRFLAGLASYLRPLPPGSTVGTDVPSGAELSARLDQVCRDVAALMSEVEGLGDTVRKASRPLLSERPQEQGAGSPRGLVGQERAMAHESHIWKGVL